MLFSQIVKSTHIFVLLVALVAVLAAELKSSDDTEIISDEEPVTKGMFVFRDAGIK